MSEAKTGTPYVKMSMSGSSPCLPFTEQLSRTRRLGRSDTETGCRSAAAGIVRAIRDRRAITNGRSEADRHPNAPWWWAARRPGGGEAALDSVEKVLTTFLFSVLSLLEERRRQ